MFTGASEKVIKIKTASNDVVFFLFKDECFCLNSNGSSAQNHISRSTAKKITAFAVHK